MLRKQTQQFLIQIRTENVVYKLLKNYKERQFHVRKVYRREVALGINCRPHCPKELGSFRDIDGNVTAKMKKLYT